MNFLQKKEKKLKDKIFHSKLLKEIRNINDPFIFYIDLKNDTIHYLIFGSKITFLQIIITTPNWDSRNNFSILEYGIKRKKIVKNYLSTIDEIIQYNFILYENEMKEVTYSWSYKDKDLEIPQDFYQVYVLNMYYIFSHNLTQYKNLKELWTSLL